MSFYLIKGSLSVDSSSFSLSLVISIETDEDISFFTMPFMEAEELLFRIDSVDLFGKLFNLLLERDFISLELFACCAFANASATIVERLLGANFKILFVLGEA